MSDGAQDAVASRVGTTLAGKYKLVRLLGAGGMGAVYEARNTWTERRVAIKLMLGELLRNDAFVARFMREARAATRIAHPNIVEVLDMGSDTDDGALYIVQEFLSGTDLRHALDKRGTMGPTEALEALGPVMSALVAAHRRGVVHRDLKPENIFLAKTAAGVTPKLIDFGIAKVVEDREGSTGLTRTGALMGTALYMSPEQARGEKSIDAQTDVWALGVVWYELLSGRVPFDGENYNQLIIEIVSAPVRRIELFAPSVPKPVADVVHRALERERDKRYPTMTAFLDAVLDCAAFGTPELRASLRRAHDTALRVGESHAPPAAPSEPSTSAPTVPATQDDSDAATTLGAGGESTRQDGTTKAVLGSARTTFSNTARELEAPASTKRRGALAAISVGLVAAVAAAGAWAIQSHTTHPPATAAHVTPLALAPTTPPPREATSTFTVNVSVRPAVGTIELDGVATQANSVVRNFPRDGRTHVVRASAPGYLPFAVEFVDAPPPPVIDLVAATPAPQLASTSAPTHEARADETSRRHPRRAPATPTQSAHTSSSGSSQSAAGANGAPLLGGEE